VTHDAGPTHDGRGADERVECRAGGEGEARGGAVLQLFPTFAALNSQIRFGFLLERKRFSRQSGWWPASRE